MNPRQPGNILWARRRHRHPQPILFLLLAAGLGVGSCLLGGLSSARAQSPGSVDTSFDPGFGPNDEVHSVATQADGKVLIGGFFESIGLTTRFAIARLNGDGSVDTSFDPGSGANGGVLSVATQADGKVLIGCNFTQVNGVTRHQIARFKGDGETAAFSTPASLTVTPPMIRCSSAFTSG